MSKERKRGLKLNFKRSKYGRYKLPLISRTEGYVIDVCTVDELLDRDIRIVKHIDDKCEHLVSGTELIKMSINKNRM